MIDCLEKSGAFCLGNFFNFLFHLIDNFFHLCFVFEDSIEVIDAGGVGQIIQFQLGIVAEPLGDDEGLLVSEKEGRLRVGWLDTELWIDRVGDAEGVMSFRGMPGSW